MRARTTTSACSTTTRGCTRRRWPRSPEALELDPKMQVAQRNLEVAYFNTGYYDRRIAELQERLRVPRGRPRGALGTGARLRAARPVGRGGDRRVHGAAPASSRTTSARSCSSGSPRRRAGNLGAAQHWFEEAIRLDPRELRHALLPRRGALQPGSHRGRARGAQARDRAESRESRRAVPAELRVRRHGAARGGARPRASARSS